jgi:hypothetical protein
MQRVAGDVSTQHCWHRCFNIWMFMWETVGAKHQVYMCWCAFFRQAIPWPALEYVIGQVSGLDLYWQTDTHSQQYPGLSTMCMFSSPNHSV